MLLVKAKAQKTVCINLAQVFVFVDKVKMNLDFTFSSESNVTFGFALLIGTQVVRLGKMNL
jgi:hypothetical protein